MRLKALVVSMVLLGALLSPLAANSIDLIDAENDDSGWTVQWVGAVTSVQIVDVDLAGSTVKIGVDKNYGPGEPDDYDVVGLMTFTMRGDTQVEKIIIVDEWIGNQSGFAWTGFNWIIMQTGAAGFDSSAEDTNTWDVSPFITLQLNVATQTLAAAGGSVANSATFSPIGELVINAARNGPFTLKETIVPEPTTCAILGMGGLVAMLRRRARR